MTARRAVLAGVCALGCLAAVLAPSKAGSRVTSAVVTWKDARGRPVNVVQTSADMKVHLIADAIGTVWQYAVATRAIFHVTSAAPLFTTTDCSGPAYVEFDATPPRAAIAIFSPSSVLEYWVAPDDVNPVTIAPRSQKSGPVCFQVEPGDTAVVAFSQLRAVTRPTALVQSPIHPEFVTAGE